MKNFILKLSLGFAFILLLCLGCSKSGSGDSPNDNGTKTPPTDSTTTNKTNKDSTAAGTAIGVNAFSLWGTCSDNPYIISGATGICVPSGTIGCGSNYLGSQQSSGQTATGMQFYGCFKGGSKAPDGSNEMAVFVCTDVINWVGYEMGFVMTLNDNALKCYVQGNGAYNYFTLNSVINDIDGYHTFKCQAESGDHSKVDFYVDSKLVCTLQNPNVNYFGDFYYFVGTTHRTSDNWSSTGQQIEMYNMVVF